MERDRHVGRPEILRTKYSGLAGEAKDALVNPARLIARPLFIPKDDGAPLPYEPWELIDNPSLHPEPREFEAFISRRAAFVPGGTRFVLEMGLMPVWFIEDATRNEAVAAMQTRGWGPLLEKIRFKDTPGDILRKTLCQSYANTLPPIRRDGDRTPNRTVLSDFDVWRSHRLRLRKVIEYITLVEHIVAWRFGMDEGLRRFETITGIPSESASASYVLDHFWIEPVIYIPDPRPRGNPDIREIMNTPQLVQWFTGETGQPEGALYWSLRGAPSKYKTVEAVCKVLDRYYGRGETKVATIEMKDYDIKASIVVESDTLPEYARSYEYLPELGPLSVAANPRPPE